MAQQFNGPAATGQRPPVAAVHVGVVRLEAPLQSALEQPLDVGSEPLLIVFDPKHVVGTRLIDRLCDVGLTPHCVDPGVASLQDERLQQLRDRLNFVGAALRSALAKGQALPTSPRLDQVPRLFAGGWISTPTQRFSVDSDDLSVDLLVGFPRPRSETFLELLRIDPAKNPAERVMRGDSILKWQKAPELIQSQFSELLHRNERVGATNRSAHDQDNNLSKRVGLPIARVV